MYISQNLMTGGSGCGMECFVTIQYKEDPHLDSMMKWLNHRSMGYLVLGSYLRNGHETLI